MRRWEARSTSDWRRQPSALAGIRQETSSAACQSQPSRAHYCAIPALPTALGRGMQDAGPHPWLGHGALQMGSRTQAPHPTWPPSCGRHRPCLACRMWTDCKCTRRLHKPPMQVGTLPCKEGGKQSAARCPGPGPWSMNSGFRVHEFRVQGSGFRAKVTVCNSKFRVPGPGLPEESFKNCIARFTRAIICKGSTAKLLGNALTPAHVASPGDRPAMPQ